MSLVFEEFMLDAVDGGALVTEATSLWDSTTRAKTSGGRLANTLAYFSVDHTRTMDAYWLSSAALSQSHYTRMGSHLSIEKHIDDLIDRQSGYWADELQDPCCNHLASA